MFGFECIKINNLFRCVFAKSLAVNNKHFRQDKHHIRYLMREEIAHIWNVGFAVSQLRIIVRVKQFAQPLFVIAILLYENFHLGATPKYAINCWMVSRASVSYRSLNVKGVESLPSGVF